MRNVLIKKEGKNCATVCNLKKTGSCKSLRAGKTKQIHYKSRLFCDWKLLRFHTWRGRSIFGSSW